MIKLISSTSSGRPYLSQTPTSPFMNPILMTKTLQDPLITGRRINNNPLELSTKESNNENLMKYPIVIESIKSKKSPKEIPLVSINEKIHFSQPKLQKTIHLRSNKNNNNTKDSKNSKSSSNVLKEKTSTVNNITNNNNNNNINNEQNTNKKILTQKIQRTSKEKALLLISKAEKKEKETIDFEDHREEIKRKTSPQEKETKKILKKTPKKKKKTKKKKEKTENEKPIEKNEELVVIKNEKTRKKAHKKKKNLKSNKKKRVVSPTAPVQEKELEFEDRISKLLMKSLEEFKTHKIQSISNKKQKQMQERQKLTQQNLRNQEIRESNFQRFFKNREFDPFASKNFKAPWGLDQQKFKKYYLSHFLKEYNVSQNSENIPPKNIPRKEIINDEARRQRLGLDFLKGMPEENIEHLIRKSKEKLIEREEHQSQSISKKKMVSEEEQQEIRRYMERKKEEIETQSIQLLLQDFLSQEKIKQNLQSLSDEIKGIFSSKHSKSLKFSSPPQRIPPSDLQMKEEDLSPINENNEFSLLYQEYQNFIAENSSKAPFSSKNKGNSASKDSSKGNEFANNFNKTHDNNNKTNNPQNNVIAVERYEHIKEKFDTLAQRFEKYINLRSSEEEKDVEPVLSPLKNNENLLENIEEEKDQLKSSTLESNNKPDPASNVVLEESLGLKDNKIESENNNIQEISNINIDENNNNDDSKNHNDIKEEEGEENLDEMDSEIVNENLQLLEHIAIMIQKVWRGYHTRKILNEYFEIMLSGEYGEFLENMEVPEGNNLQSNEVIMEDELEDQMESMHKENQMKKKSRSADIFERYQPENENDEYKLQEAFYPNNNNMNSKAISHNVLYNNRPDSKSSEDYDQGDKIMHISDIMEDEHNNPLSKSQEKSKEAKKNRVEEKKTVLEENLLKKSFNESENNTAIKMPPTDIIESTDEFRRKLKEELENNNDLAPASIKSSDLILKKDSLHFEDNNEENYIKTDKTFEESDRKEDFLEENKEENIQQMPNPNNLANQNQGLMPSFKQHFNYKRNNKLMLNVDEIEKEHQVHEKFMAELSNKIMDPALGELRKALCSEKLIREQASRSLTSSQNFNKPLKIRSTFDSSDDPNFKDSKDSKSRESKENENMSIFEQDPFKEFTYKIYQDFLNNDLRKSSDFKENKDEKGSFLEKREKDTPKGQISKKGVMEKWINPDESHSQGKKKESPLLEQKWNSPFYGFKKTQRDFCLLQRAGDVRNSYYNSYYSDEGDKNHNEHDQLALLSRSWHGFTSQKKPSLNFINQLNENQLSGPSKNIKIIEKFEVNEDHKNQYDDHLLEKNLLKVEDQQKNAELSSKNSSFKQNNKEESSQMAVLFNDASSITKSRKNETDSNRVNTEEDAVGLDDEVNIKKDDESQNFSNDFSLSGNKQNRSPLHPVVVDDSPQILEGLPLDSSLENNGAKNNEIDIKDERAYKKDLNINTVGNLIVEDIINDFYHDIISSEMLANKMINFFQMSPIQVYKPINTTIFAVDEYLNILNHFIKERFTLEFLANINQPYDKDALLKLKLYNESKSENSNKDFQIKPIDILPNDLFLELEDLLIREESEESKSQFSIELDQIHKKLIFDCMNESLEYFRPFDIRGKPTPWKLNQKKLTYSDIDQNNMEIVLEQAKNKVIEWCLFQCGILADNSDMNINYDLLNQMKQERLEKMIINEIYEKEEKWISYDDWESVVQIEISDMIFEGLLFDAAKDLGFLKNNR